MKAPFFPFVAVTLAAGFALVGCGSGSSGGGGSSTGFGPIAGTWRATAFSGGGPDNPCPATFLVTNTSGTVSPIGCGSNDTFTFNTDGTYTGFKAPVQGSTATTAETFTGRWSQFQSRVMLTVDNPNGTTVNSPYAANLDFSNPDQFTITASGFSTINRFTFTRQ